MADNEASRCLLEPARERSRGQQVDPAFGDDQLPGLERALVLFIALAEIQVVDAGGGGGLCHPQMQPQAWRVFRQLDIVGREPAGEVGLRSQAEVNRHDAFVAAKHREGTRAPLRTCLKQVPDQARDPSHPESVPVPRTPVLGRLPTHEHIERLAILVVELEACRS